jgi:cation diffusion facilitator CzcD-associated flavoprotein CzcO
VPLEGVYQPAVQRYAEEWVRRHGLGPYIRLGCEVDKVSRAGGEWTVRTKQGKHFRANYLIVASGVQNEPWVPDVERSESLIQETHSADLRRPEDLAGQTVTVVGGGASSQDLVNLAIDNGAKDIHWVYRTVKWFQPTRRKKQRTWPNLRELGLGQSIHGTRAASALMRWVLRRRYGHFGISELAPDEPFDFEKHQLIPGRAALLRNLAAVSRHRAEIRSVHGREITLTNGERFESDRLLWATGYRMNLRYLGLPEYSHVRRLRELFPKLGSLVRALDYPNLFFVGVTLINSTSSTPFLAAVEAKTIISHMMGDCEIPEKTLPHHVAYWDLVRYFATFDRANYRRWWKVKYLWLALRYEVLQNRSIRVTAGRRQRFRAADGAVGAL